MSLLLRIQDLSFLWFYKLLPIFCTHVPTETCFEAITAAQVIRDVAVSKTIMEFPLLRHSKAKLKTADTGQP